MTGRSVLPVSEHKLRALTVRLNELGIREEDLVETFVTSQGKGGQNVNKVSTCVVLLHTQSGTRIKCQETRSQGLNRYLARKLLVEKLEQEAMGEKSRREQEAERIRRQKRRRSRRAKNRMLADKHARSSLKSLRGRVNDHESG